MPRKKGSKNKKGKLEKAVDVLAKSPDSIRGIPLGTPFKLAEIETTAPVKITLKSLGRVFTAEGSTFEEAIGKIKISGGARALSVITIEKDGIKKDRILNARQTSGLFGQGSPSMREIHLKGVKQILGV